MQERLIAPFRADARFENVRRRFRTRFDTDPTNPGLYMGPYVITEVAPGFRSPSTAARSTYIAA